MLTPTVLLKDLAEVNNDLQMKVRDWRNSKEVSQYFIIDEISEETHINWLKNLKENNNSKAFIIYFSESPVGLAYFKNINQLDKTAEWGIFIHSKKYRGQGIGSKSAKLSLESGFNELNLENIYLEVFKNNTSAINVYEKFGFKTVNPCHKQLIKNDKTINVVLMKLSKNTFQEKSI